MFLHAATTTEPKTRPAPAPGTQDQPAPAPTAGEGWAVILFNDDVHDMFYVTHLLMQATGFGRVRSWRIMLTAHHNGKALVTITEKDEAERIAAVLQGGGLTAAVQAM